VSGAPPKYVWGAEAADFQPANPAYLIIYRRL